MSVPSFNANVRYRPAGETEMTLAEKIRWEEGRLREALNEMENARRRAEWSQAQIRILNEKARSK